MTSGPAIQWPELVLKQKPYRHYVLLPQRIPIQWSVSGIAKGRSDVDPLLNWAAKLIVKEYEESGDPKKALKAAKVELAHSGNFGTLVHDSIEAHLKPAMPDEPYGCGMCDGVCHVYPCGQCGFEDTSHDLIRLRQRISVLEQESKLPEGELKKARLATASAVTWLKCTGWEPVETERKIVHSVVGVTGHPIWYAGTFDLLCRDNQGCWHLVDWKTSTAIRTKYFVQMGGYAEALSALGIEVYSVTIVRMPRSGGVEVATTQHVGAFRQLFIEELRLHQRYHDAKFHVQACQSNELVMAESGQPCAKCEKFSRYITQELCVPCYAKNTINESETKND